MGQAAFVDGDPGDPDPLLKLLLELVADHFGMAAKGRLLVLDIVIGIFGGDGADRALDLDEDELGVIVDVEQGLGGVGDPPHDVGRDLDRVAAKVVHLEPLRGDVVDPGRDLGPGQPRPAPAQAGIAVAAFVIAEQEQGRRLVGLEQIEAARHQQPHQYPDDEKRKAGNHRALEHQPGPDRAGGQRGEQDQQHDIAVIGAGGPLTRKPKRLAAGSAVGGGRHHSLL